MMKGFCQIICLSALLLSCSGGERLRPDESELLSRVEPVWYAIDSSVRLSTWTGEVLPHLFYDASPELNERRGMVNFVPLAVAGQPTSYWLDPVSGQRVFSHQSCVQKDVWGERGELAASAPYTVGVVPRHMDQLNQPQRVLVFGGADRFDQSSPITYRVRVVGGVVEQLCPLGECTKDAEWSGRLTLVAVDGKDQRFRDVRGMEELQALVDWDKVRGHLENGEGRNPMGEGGAPAVRAGRLLGRVEVLDFLAKHSTAFSSKELRQLRASCSNLYGLLWREAGAPNVLAEPPKTAADVKKRVKYVEEMRKLKHPVFFNERLGAFFSRHGDAFATCARTVFPGNPNSDIHRFWFTSWLALYARLHREGWAYDCQRGSWSENRLPAPEAMKALRDTASCSTRSLDQAFSQLPAFLRVQPGLSGRRWRFVDWDSGVLGSHAKVHGWVSLPERRFACGSDLNARARAGWRVIPEGEPWTPRYVQENVAGPEYVH